MDNRTCRNKRRRNNRMRRTRKKAPTIVNEPSNYTQLSKQFLSELNTLIQQYPQQVVLRAFIQLSQYVEQTYINYPADDMRIISGIDVGSVTAHDDPAQRELFANINMANLVQKQSDFLTNMVGGKNIKDLLR